MSLFEMSAQPLHSQLSPGQFGPYYLREIINSGGVADIWLATNPKGEPFALKCLREVSVFNFVVKKRFFRGCEVLSKIHHNPYVIGYVEHGKTNGVPFLAMEYIEASNLKQLFAREDPLLQEFLGNILIDMALGLEHVHDSGFIHLDFKPENVLVSRNGNVRLVDFDLAQPKPGKPKKMPDNPGTPAYMAPEQLLHQPLDHRADLFAYGVAAYEILTGKKPFAGDNAEEILRRQLDRSQELVQPREYNPNIPASLEKLILKCLERDMEKRYPFTSVLVRDVQQALYV